MNVAFVSKLASFDLNEVKQLNKLCDLGVGRYYIRYEQRRRFQTFSSYGKMLQYIASNSVIVTEVGFFDAQKSDGI